jgi:hypothetical protein
MSYQENLITRLRTAAGVVDAAELPTDLRGAAFVLAFRESADAAASSAGTGAGSDVPAADAGGPPVGDRRAQLETPPRPEDPASRLAYSLGVEPDVLEAVFDVRDDDVELILPRRALDLSLRRATAQVIQLAVAGRQGAGLEAWTDVSRLRRTCDRLGVLDSNFSRVLSSLRGNGLRVREGSGKPQISMDGNGFEHASELVRDLVAGLS